MFAAEFGTGEVLWSILWFSLFFMWIWLVISVFADIFRSRSLSGWGKALWAVAIIILPFLGIFMYLIVNGDKMNQRAVQGRDDADQAFKTYVQQAAGSGASESEQLAKLAEMHDSGALRDDEYARAKAKVLGA